MGALSRRRISSADDSEDGDEGRDSRLLNNNLSHSSSLSGEIIDEDEEEVSSLGRSRHGTNASSSSPPLSAQSASNSSPPSATDSSLSSSGSPTTTAMASVQAALAALQAGQMSLNQLQSLGAQSVWPQNPLMNSSPVTMTPPQTVGETAPVFGQTELQALHLALQQQQQNLQQQLQNFILLQQRQQQIAAAAAAKSTPVTAAAILQNQVQTALTQANAQIKRLQRQQHHLNSKNANAETPKARDLLKKQKMSTNPAVSLALSSLTPVPPQTSSSPSSLSPPDSIRPLSISTSPSSPPPPTSTPPHMMHPQLHSGPPTLVPRLDLPADENVDLEELEHFAKEFKQRRIKLGYTQGDVGLAMGKAMVELLGK